MIDYKKDIILLLDSPTGGVIKDDSPYNTPLTNVGGVSVDAEGYYIFNGNNYLDIPNGNFYFGNTTSDELSFEIDVIFTDYPSNSSGYYSMNLMSSDNWVQNYRSWLLQVGGTATSLHSIVFYTIDSNGVYHDVIVSYNFLLNTRYVIGITASNNSVSISINNIIVVTNNTTWNFTFRSLNPTQPIRIGKSLTPPYDYQLKGKMKLRVSKKSTDITKISTTGFKWYCDVNLTENIEPNLFALNLISTKTGESFNYYTNVSAGNNIKLGSIIQHPVHVICSPNQGFIWESDKAYSLNDLVFPTNPSIIPYYFKRTIAGVSGIVEPTWNAVTGEYTTDNDIPNSWQCVSRLYQPIIHSPIILS